MYIVHGADALQQPAEPSRRPVAATRQGRKRDVGAYVTPDVAPAAPGHRGAGRYQRPGANRGRDRAGVSGSAVRRT